MPTAKKPHVFKPRADAPSKLEVDYDNSEDYKIMEAYGRPRVVYAIKANKYFKDFDCEKEFTDEEIQALGLPIPVEIDAQRKKMIKKQLDENPAKLNMNAIYRATLPPKLEPPDHIKERLIGYSEKAKEERMIARLNRQTLGKV